MSSDVISHPSCFINKNNLEVLVARGGHETKPLLSSHSHIYRYLYHVISYHGRPVGTKTVTDDKWTSDTGYSTTITLFIISY